MSGGLDVSRYTPPSSLSASSGVSIVTDPSFEEAGHAGARSLPRPSSAGWHAVSPVACPGLTARPDGSSMVVFCRCAVAMPSALSRPSWGMRTSAVRPVGVSPRVVSGAIVSDGPKGRRSQPPSPAGAPAASCRAKLSSSLGAPVHGSASAVNVAAAELGATQDVGRVSRGMAAAVEGQPLTQPGARRSWSWLRSAGMPQIVRLLEISCRWGRLSARSVMP